MRFTPPEVTLPTADPLNDPFLLDFAQPAPQPEPEPDRCNCKKEKKKEKKKRKPRDQCWKGTYVQHARGISYSRKEQVPCDSGPTKAIRKLTKKLKPGRFPGAGFIGGMSGGQMADLAVDAFNQFYPIIDDYLKRTNKPSKKASKKRNRKAKTKPGRVPGTVYTSPFPGD